MILHSTNIPHDSGQICIIAEIVANVMELEDYLKSEQHTQCYQQAVHLEVTQSDLQR